MKIRRICFIFCLFILSCKKEEKADALQAQIDSLKQTISQNYEGSKNTGKNTLKKNGYAITYDIEKWELDQTASTYASVFCIGNGADFSFTYKKGGDFDNTHAVISTILLSKLGTELDEAADKNLRLIHHSLKKLNGQSVFSLEMNTQSAKERDELYYHCHVNYIDTTTGVILSVLSYPSQHETKESDNDEQELLNGLTIVSN
jgi:hypothetical protein